MHIREHQLEVVQAVGQQGPEGAVVRGDPDSDTDDDLPACDGKCLVEVFGELCPRRKDSHTRNSEISRLVLFVSLYFPPRLLEKLKVFATTWSMAAQSKPGGEYGGRRPLKNIITIASEQYFYYCEQSFLLPSVFYYWQQYFTIASSVLLL